MIPAEAVEAAAKAIASHYGSGANNWEWYLTEAAEVLEAAAPHLMAGALEDAKDALNPGGSYVLQNIAKWLSERAATERTTQ